MHTSVEKHSLRITESCGTLADTFGFIISAPSRSLCAIPERQLRQSPHCRKCALQSLRLPYSLSYSENISENISRIIAEDATTAQRGPCRHTSPSYLE
jgi:hypothetical protein